MNRNLKAPICLSNNFLLYKKIYMYIIYTLFRCIFIVCATVVVFEDLDKSWKLKEVGYYQSDFHLSNSKYLGLENYPISK